MKKPGSGAVALFILWDISVTFLAAGWLQEWLVTPPAGDSLLARFVYPFQVAALQQLGLVGLLAAAFITACRAGGEAGRGILGSAGALALKAGLAAAIFLVAGELALRVALRDGMSFSSHYGPLVRRFERDFRYNRFDGPSRGPEVSGPKAPGAVRVMVMGDSITWGQGVRHEADLYTFQLLDRLRRENPGFEMAVLAGGGREIDHHLAELQQHGRELDPDVIVYQWSSNDLELTKGHRPSTPRVWRGLFFHPILVRISYLWYFVDYQLDRLLPQTDSRSRSEVLVQNYGSGSAGWAGFADLFNQWAKAATGLTPRVVVLLYPWTEGTSGFQLDEIHAQMRALCAASGVQVVDLIDALDDYSDDFTSMWASVYDAHPNEQVHERIAAVLYTRLRGSWPELFPVD